MEPIIISSDDESPPNKKIKQTPLVFPQGKVMMTYETCITQLVDKVDWINSEGFTKMLALFLLYR